jgi:hypothetical protein
MQHVPMLGDVVITTGIATVKGHGVVFLDHIDLKEVARPVKRCAGRFFFTVHSAAFDVGGFGAGIGSVIEEMDVGAIFPVQQALCFGSSYTSLAETIALRPNGSEPVSNSTGAASLVNSMVWELMPRMRHAAQTLLDGSTLFVVFALLTLLGLTFSVAAFIHDDSQLAVARAVAAALILGIAGYWAADTSPVAAAAGALVSLLLFSVWRVLACVCFYVTTGWATPHGRKVVLITVTVLSVLSYLAFFFRGTTSARWLFLTYCLTLSTGAASWLFLPFCAFRTYLGVRAVGSASVGAAGNPRPGDSADAGLKGHEDSTAVRVNLFLELNHRLGGLPRCYLSMLFALVLSGFVIVFSILNLTRDVNSRMQWGEAPMLAPAPPPAPPILPPIAPLPAGARVLSYSYGSD